MRGEEEVRGEAVEKHKDVERRGREWRIEEEGEMLLCHVCCLFIYIYIFIYLYLCGCVYIYFKCIIYFSSYIILPFTTHLSYGL
jgi:hypothetical protein